MATKKCFCFVRNVKKLMLKYIVFSIEKKIIREEIKSLVSFKKRKFDVPKKQIDLWIMKAQNSVQIYFEVNNIFNLIRSETLSCCLCSNIC